MAFPPYLTTNILSRSALVAAAVVNAAAANESVFSLFVVAAAATPRRRKCPVDEGTTAQVVGDDRIGVVGNKANNGANARDGSKIDKLTKREDARPIIFEYMATLVGCFWDEEVFRFVCVEINKWSQVMDGLVRGSGRVEGLRKG